jgi:hypothetical protein
MPRLLREPLLHFLLLGALLFALYGWLQRGALKAPDEIVVTGSQVQSMQAQFRRTRQRAPTPQELQGLVDAWVREDIYYREGVAMGLDRDDSIVRRRVAQKLEFIADGSAPAAPTLAELQAWLDEHAANYRVESNYSLRQIYFNPDRRGARLAADVAAAQRALGRGQPVDGDATMLPATLERSGASEVARVFGNEFAQALQVLPLGGWQGPVRSGFGDHLVELTARTEARPATLDEVRGAVERDWLQARSLAASKAFYERLRAKYSIRIESAGATLAGKPVEP